MTAVCLSVSGCVSVCGVCKTDTKNRVVNQRGAGRRTHRRL